MNKYDALYIALTIEELSHTYYATPEEYGVPSEFADIFDAGLKYQQKRMMLISCDSLTEFEKRDRPQYDDAVTRINTLLEEKVVDLYSPNRKDDYLRLPKDQLSVDTRKTYQSYGRVKLV